MRSQRDTKEPGPREQERIPRLSPFLSNRHTQAPGKNRTSLRCFCSLLPNPGGRPCVLRMTVPAFGISFDRHKNTNNAINKSPLSTAGRGLIVIIFLL